MGSKKNKIRLKRKRLFQGNQYIIASKRNLIESTNSLSDTTGDHSKLDIGNHGQQQNIDGEIDFSTPVSASHQKLNNSNNFIHSSDTDEEKFFFIINFQISTELIQLVGHCKGCSSTNIFIKCTAEERQGFSQKFYLECKDCTWCHGFYSSPEHVFPDKDAKGKNPFQVNVRFVIAFREIGKENEAMRTFTKMMNMPPPLSHQTYNNINLSLHNIYEKAAKEIMLPAVNGLKEKENVSIDENLDIDIGIDGSRQKRGHSSLNGVVTGVPRENKKINDYKVFSKFCKSRALWENKKGTEEYIVW